MAGDVAGLEHLFEDCLLRGGAVVAAPDFGVLAVEEGGIQHAGVLLSGLHRLRCCSLLNRTNFRWQLPLILDARPPGRKLELRLIRVLDDGDSEYLLRLIAIVVIIDHPVHYPILRTAPSILDAGKSPRQAGH